MPAHLAHDTAAALGADAQHSDSRSLFLSRYATPGAKDTKDSTPRKAWFNALIQRKAQTLDRESWLPAAASVLHARLESRLMVGMANGVMENAGLTLDRFGLPVIPGSAVKGCARRMALQALHDWIAVGSTRPLPEDLGAPCCAGFQFPAEMLSVIALTFGWVEQDWEVDEKGNSRSDLAWACGPMFANIWKGAAEILAAHFYKQVPPQNAEAPWRSLPNFAGAVAFLSASPNRDPGLVLDVVTCHHGDYYGEKKDERGDLKMPVARDTEEPVPVFFPAVQEQSGNDHFTFVLLPLRRADDKLIAFARQCIATGLGTFGLGAKSNAGYGGFDASDATHQAIASHLQTERHRQQEEAKSRAEKEAHDREIEEKRRAKTELDQALAGLPADQQEDKKLELLSDAQFDAKARAFTKNKGGPCDAEKQAIVRALRGPRAAYWQTFKTKATKGELATIDQAIRALSKAMNLGKMP